MNKTPRSQCIYRFVVATWAVLCAGAVQSADPTRTFDLGGGVKIELIRIEPGIFTQGSVAGRPGRADDEIQRQVTISQAFYIGKSPVTRGQFAQFVTATGYRTEAENGTSGGSGFENGALVQKSGFNWRNPGFAQTDDHPVVLVTWDDAQAFLKWLSDKTRESIQLPTEAEWEYACRAGTTTDFYSGDGEEAAARIAWYKAIAGNGTRPVGQKEANAWGLVDMAGNVDQWCRDWYGPYALGPVTDPLETRSNLSDKPRRVLRGGSWFKDVKNCRSAARFRSTPGSRNADFGFRISFRPTAMTTEVESPAPARPQSQPPVPPVVPQQPVIPAPPVQRVPQQPSPQPSNMPATGGSMLMGVLCPCALVLVGGGVLIFLIVLWRGTRSSRTEPTLPIDSPQTGPQSTGPTARPGHAGTRPRRPPRIVSDGFWLEDPIYAPGSIVRYTCLMQGEPTDGEFTVGPGHQGHFVYTGGTPADVEIREIIPSSGMHSPDTGEHLYGSTGAVLGGFSTPPIPPPPPRVSSAPPPVPPTPPAHLRGGFPPAY